MTSPTRPSEKPLDVRTAIAATSRTVEAVLFYATTQLAAWVTTPELLDGGAGGGGVGVGGMDPEAAAAGTEESAAVVAVAGMVVDSAGINHGERRATRREPTVMTERMRRGLTGEISSELKAVLEKARTVLAKSQQTAGEKQQGAVDIAGVLLSFLNQRVICST
jgi:nuclear pore complex protein Nup188